MFSQLNAILDQDPIIGREKYFAAAVLVPFFQADGELWLLFEKRAAHVRQGNEVGFPGGAREACDASYAETAVRETTEELGIAREDIQVLGKLGTLVTPHGVLIEAYVGALEGEALASIHIDTREVAYLIRVPLAFFAAHPPEVYELDVVTHPYGDIDDMRVPFPAVELGLPERYHRPWRGKTRRVYLYKYKDEIIWGITAQIVYEIVQRMRAGRDADRGDLASGIDTNTQPHEEGR
jgi:coenzyme A diphosphatase NUDT7